MEDEDAIDLAPLPWTAHLTGWEDVVFELEDDFEEVGTVGELEG